MALAPSTQLRTPSGIERRDNMGRFNCKNTSPAEWLNRAGRFPSRLGDVRRVGSDHHGDASRGGRCRGRGEAADAEVQKGEREETDAALEGAVPAVQARGLR